MTRTGYRPAARRVSAWVCLLLVTHGFAVGARGQAPPRPGGELSADVRIDVSAAFYHQASLGVADGNHVRLPDALAVRRALEPDVAAAWGLAGRALTDSPMGHGASHVAAHVWRRAAEGLTLYASINADHQGFSFGTYNQDRVAIYPRYRIDFCRGLLGQTSGCRPGRGQIAFHLGTFEDYRHYEGLTLYNMDVQAVYAHVQLGRVRITHLHVGDLLGGIGLNINDLIDTAVSLEGVAVTGDWRADLRLGAVDYNNDWEDRVLDAINLSLGLYPSQTSRLYGQLGYRLTDRDFDWRLRYAALLGARHTYSARRLRLTARAEYRHYGGIFNYRLNSETSVHYRDPERSDYGNYKGDQLYPLDLIKRTFSQWAVFTEYHARYLDALTVQGDLRVGLAHSVALHAEYDVNLIDPSGEDAFTYPFYKLGIAYEPVAGALAMLSLTNKTMNLDKHYPTFYLLDSPVVQLEVRRDLPGASDE